MREVNHALPLREVATEFGQLADVLAAVGADSLDAGRLVRFAAEAVPNAQHAALTFVCGTRRPQTLASTGEVPRRVDALQYETGQGPCLDAITESDVRRTDDLALELQWPEFAQRAVVATGVRSMCCVRLHLDGDDRGALSFYAERPRAFGDMDVGVASLFAAFASLALRGVRYRAQAADLTLALRSSRQIGMAIGILMARRRITSDAAFEQLRRASQHLNRKLRDIAHEVTEIGDLPGPR
ncbi:transcriptional regulator [Pilimelia anulata]|uniref:Transcriptional regulator n=1 Tax=Pilimelia anulata TaxID=53371 RepID=A0A8J3F8B1_9ACTN|nr:GAF and ANTAR domain-containing protein [Pilimelia anulata]GGJ87210.1 transcriptional regulator [Pilimelia anulata]